MYSGLCFCTLFEDPKKYGILNFNLNKLMLATFQNISMVLDMFCPTGFLWGEKMLISF